MAKSKKQTVPNKRKRYSEEYGRRLADEYVERKRTGQSTHEICKREGIVTSVLLRMVKQYKGKDVVGPQGVIATNHPVVVNLPTALPAPEPPPPPPSSPPSLLLPPASVPAVHGSQSVYRRRYPEAKQRELATEYLRRKQSGESISEMEIREGIHPTTLRSMVRKVYGSLHPESNTSTAPMTDTKAPTLTMIAKDGRKAYSEATEKGIVEHYLRLRAAGQSVTNWLKQDQIYGGYPAIMRMLRKHRPDVRVSPGRGPKQISSTETSGDWMITYANGAHDEIEKLPGIDERAALDQYMNLSTQGKSNVRLWRAVPVEVVVSARIKGR